jgi:hypothetical protein
MLTNMFDSTSTLKLFRILYQLNIITDFYHKKHAFSALTKMINPPEPKENWIRFASVSLQIDYIELIPVTRRG